MGRAELRTFGVPPMPTAYQILVVDDDADIRELARLLLEREGHRVRGASNGQVALRLLAEQRFDVVLTDLLMPDRDGLEVIAELRRKHPAVRIIASSGGGRIARETYLEIAQSCGAHAVLPKPYTRQELCASLVAAFPRRAAGGHGSRLGGEPHADGQAHGRGLAGQGQAPALVVDAQHGQ